MNRPQFLPASYLITNIWQSNKNILKLPICAFITSRFFCFLLVYTGHLRRPFLSPVPGGWEGINSWWLNPWTTYDSKWFMSIATSGYEPHTTAFFPLYPLILKLGGPHESYMAIIGFLTSNVSFFLSLLLIQKITELDYDEKTARISVWMLAFFPTTAFFSAVYSDSFFLFLILLAFYMVRLEKWLFAGISGLLAALVRNPGVLIFAVLLLEYSKSINYQWSDIKLRPFSYIFLPLLGFLMVQVYFWIIFGNSLAGIESQSFYFRKIGWPWIPIWKDLLGLFTLNSNIITFFHIAAVILLFVLLVNYFKTIRLSYVCFIAGIMFMHLTYQRYIPPYTIATIRYMAITFPFTQLMALSFKDAKGNLLKYTFFAYYLIAFVIFSYSYGLKIFLG